jgi:polar amino acid transport system permease protein
MEHIDISKLEHARPVHLGRIASAAFLLLIAGNIVYAFAVGTIDWPVVGEYMFNPGILRGALTTVVISVAAMAIGIVVGTITAISRASRNVVLTSAAMFYAWLFRGAPMILQLLIWYNLALVFPMIGIPGIWEAKTVAVMSPLLATLIALSLNQGAYTSEIIRSGMLAVDAGQYEAAKSIGMTYSDTLRRIILPQAMRVVVPPLGNEFIGLLKTTALASIIGFGELLGTVQDIYYTNTKIMEMLFVATIWYLVIVSLLSVLQIKLEKRFARGFANGGRHG